MMAIATFRLQRPQATTPDILCKQHLGSSALT